MQMNLTKTEKEQMQRYIQCSSCDFVLECKERGQHDNCIKYKPNKENMNN